MILHALQKLWGILLRSYKATLVVGVVDVMGVIVIVPSTSAWMAMAIVVVGRFVSIIVVAVRRGATQLLPLNMVLNKNQNMGNAVRIVVFEV